MRDCPEAHISLSALRANYRRVKAISAPAKVFCVVKADGYGHGAARVALALSKEGAELFAVARLSEALALRKVLPRAELLILGHSPPESAPLLTSMHLIQTVGGLSYAKALAAAAPAPVRIHLKLDGGMGRLGLSLSDKGLREGAEILSMPRLSPEAVLAHLPTADDPRDPSSFRRIGEVRAAASSLPRRLPLHILSSAGLLRFGSLGMPFVRSGILLYGYAPSDRLTAEGFLPVMRLYAPVLAVRTLCAGESVSYGSRFIAPTDMQTATLGIGYADGLPRSLSGASFLLGGRPIPILGRICMDMTVCHIPNGFSIREGDLLPIFGEDCAQLSHLSRAAASIPYELLSALTARVSRISADE